MVPRDRDSDGLADDKGSVFTMGLVTVVPTARIAAWGGLRMAVYSEMPANPVYPVNR